MFLRSSLLLILLAGSGAVRAQEEQAPNLDGYVTRAGTPEDFDVNGIHVLCRAAADKRDEKNALQPGESCRPHPYGEHLLLFGRLDKKAATMHPKHVESPDHPEGKAVSGFALVDAKLGPGLLRADGYAIRIVPSTKISRQPPLAADALPQTGQWLRYSGKRAEGGTIEATTLDLIAPAVSTSEQDLRDKNEFDPAAVSEDDRQSTVGKLFLGTNYKRVPAAHDPVLQRRVASIGERLVPAVQKNLASGDPSKIDFRFQVVESVWKDAVTMPNGIVLVPEPLAELLNDDQLAAVLADNIAAALEKQTYRALPGNHARTAAQLGTLLIPGVGLATQVGTSVSAYNDNKHFVEQSGRGALILMHDAGFDIRQAPLAWWRLSTSKEDFYRAGVPYRAAYQFQVLSTAWLPESPLSLEPVAKP